jgi:putative transposase
VRNTPPINLWRDKYGHLTRKGKNLLVHLRLHKKQSVSTICHTLGISKKTYYYWWNRYDQYGMDGLIGPRPPSMKVKTKELSTKEKRFIKNERQKGRTFQEIADDLGVAKSTVWYWWNRYLKEGRKALKGKKSRVPHTIYTTHPDVVDAVVKNRKENQWGPHKIVADLKRCKGIVVSHSVVYRILAGRGLITPTKRRGVQRKYTRWQRKHPDSLWQIDLHDIKSGPDKGKVLITALDDCSRKIIVSHVQNGYSIAEFLKRMKEIFTSRKPRQILTDNGSQFVSVINLQDNDRTEFQKLLLQNGIQHIRARVKHPQTLGKIERFHRTFEEELDCAPVGGQVVKL